MSTDKRSGRRRTSTNPLRAVREARGLGLREVARKVDIDPGHLSRIERGLVGPSLDVLTRLARELGLRELEGFLKSYERNGSGR